MEDDEVSPSDLNKEDVEIIKNIVDKKLAIFFFACGIPFKIVENKFFLEFVKTLCHININYKPPCRQTLASTVLSDVHEDVEEEKKKLLQNTDSVLLIDGWRNKSANRKFLVCTLRNINTPQIFLSFHDSSLEREDGVSLAENIEAAIKLAKEKYDTNVFAIVSDNDSKIVSGGRIAQNCSNSNLIQSTCSSHSGNLLIKNFTDDELCKKLRDIANVFHDPKLDSLLLMLGGSKIQNFPDTRFCYLRDTCNSILKNLPFLKQICTLQDVTVADEIFENLFDENFISKLTETVANLDPICTLINKCQDPLYNVADAAQQWLSLKLPSSDYNEIINKRIKKAVWPVAYCANYLHHNYRGLLLNEEQKILSEQFLTENADQTCHEEFVLFIQNRNEFNQLAEKCTDPITFWTMCSFQFPNLSSFSVKLMLIPASTALIESFFSHWTYVHNLYRNRLKNDKSADLVNIYHCLRYINLNNEILKQ